MENEVIENFLEKCRVDIQLTKQEIKDSIDNLTKDYLHLCYKIAFFDDLMDIFKANRGGVGHYAILYAKEEHPLQKIYMDYLSDFTERKLITENGLYKLLDKKGVWLWKKK